MEYSKKPLIIVKPQDGTGLSVVGDSYRIVISGKETLGQNSFHLTILINKTE